MWVCTRGVYSAHFFFDWRRKYFCNMKFFAVHSQTIFSFPFFFSAPISCHPDRRGAEKLTDDNHEKTVCGGCWKFPDFHSPKSTNYFVLIACISVWIHFCWACGSVAQYNKFNSECSAAAARLGLPPSLLLAQFVATVEHWRRRVGWKLSRLDDIFRHNIGSRCRSALEQ